MPTGDITLEADNTSGFCTWTYNIIWGDGGSSSFVSKPGITESASHKYVHPGIYTIDVNIPPGSSSDPARPNACGPLDQRYVVEVPNYRPDTFINTPPAPSPGSTVNSKDATFTYTSNRDHVTFECSLDSSPFSDCPLEGQDYSDLADGQHTFQVRARDAGNNEDLSPATRTWTVDTTAPSTPAITDPADNSFDTDGNFTVSGTADAGSTVRLFEGSASGDTTQVNASGQWSIDLWGVTQGSHTYTAKATDAAGNTSEASAPMTVTVSLADTVKPSVVGMDPLASAPGVLRGTNVTATFSEDMKGTTVTRTTFKVVRKGTTTAIGAAVSYDPATKKATLDPNRSLVAGATYKATVTKGATDLAGNALDQNPTLAGLQPKTWSFTVKR